MNVPETPPQEFRWEREMRRIEIAAITFQNAAHQLMETSLRLESLCAALASRKDADSDTPLDSLAPHDRRREESQAHVVDPFGADGTPLGMGTSTERLDSDVGKGGREAEEALSAALKRQIAARDAEYEARVSALEKMSPEEREEEYLSRWMSV